MKVIFVIACVTVMAADAITSGHSGFGIGVMSKRESDDGTDAIYEMIQSVLDKARQGILSSDIAKAAVGVQAAVDSILDSHGGKVPVEATQKLIDEVAATFNGNTAVSSLFADPLTYEGVKLDAALTLWNALVEKAKASEAAGESVDPALAGISMTATAITSIVKNAEETYKYLQQIQGTDGQKNPDKRWKFDGGINHDPWRGTSYSLGISHQWGDRRRRQIIPVLSKVKRQWSAGIEGTQDPSNGYGINGNIGYKDDGFEAGANIGHSQYGGTSVGFGLSYRWKRI